MTASLCMCRHTCLHLGHSRATGSHLRVRAASQRHNSTFVTLQFILAMEPGLFRWDQETAQQTHQFPAPASPAASSSAPVLPLSISPALMEQTPDTRRSSESAALSCTTHTEPTCRPAALSCWRSEHLSGHFAATESLYKEMPFLPRSPGPQQHPTRSTSLPREGADFQINQS